MTRGNPMIDEEDQEQPKVLLVDDVEVTLLLTSIALRERGFAVTEATSGEPGSVHYQWPSRFTLPHLHCA